MDSWFVHCMLALAIARFASYKLRYCAQVQNTQAYVISGVEERWLSTRQVLLGLGIQPQRVIPIKPSLKLAEREFSVCSLPLHSVTVILYCFTRRRTASFALLSSSRASVILAPLCVFLC